jgi:exopolysaccharide biosynthesis protein
VINGLAMTHIRSWFKENQTLAIFLLTQAAAVAIGGASLIAYYVKMETRVSTMETRGASYTVDRLNKMDEQIAILKEKTDKNSHSIDRIVDVMTRELGKRP